MQTIPEARALHRRSVAASATAVALVRPADLDRPTPCTEWDLRQLLAHMIGQNHGFATAVESGDAPLEAYADREPEEGAYAGSVARVTTAFAAAPDDRRVLLRELNPDQSFDLLTVLAIHSIDSLVHAWDVGAALGRAVEPPADLVAMALQVARQIPDGDERDAPGAAFAHALAARTDEDWGQTLALLGRDPAWRPERSPAAADPSH